MVPGYNAPVGFVMQKLTESWSLPPAASETSSLTLFIFKDEGEQQHIYDFVEIYSMICDGQNLALNIVSVRKALAVVVTA